MARLTSPPPESNPAEWGKRLTYLACLLIPLLLLLVLILNDHQRTRTQIPWDKIELSTTPPMPAADFLREVKAAGKFGDTLDPNEPGFFEKLQQACFRHDWVEQVNHIALARPNQLLMDLTFRTPVARLQRGLQVHLIDRFGKILLPLTPDQGSTLVPLIGWDQRSSNDPEAMTWLTQAGQLAYDLRADLPPWNIAGIYLVRDVPLDLADLRLRTKAGTYIIWQTLKGAAGEEPSTAEKLSRLRVYQERFGSLEAPAGQLLDVRIKEGLQRRPIQ